MDDYSPGIIVFYLPDKGYGYVRLADTREEFHFRRQHLRVDSVQRGDRVRFILRQGRQGYFADAIEPAGVV
ncbi:hypothetical protein LEM8419_00155 [Neolewinella maritima]|uniref:Cold shock domain-containing protein n=1 Tax=Neolewinella maritima TaxID=1383882 RepID=A0ABM9AW29_9BACT|nr:cold shock domain-containing protein [Neolewinella maritima]CAH0998840.1 hypothetical protein LEM8419_00155 [Neolewinella maritima]